MINIQNFFKAAINTRYWDIEILRRSCNQNTYVFNKLYYKWWNPFANIRVVRDVLKTYGPAAYFIYKKKYKNALDVGSAFGMGTFMINSKYTKCDGVEISDEKIKISKNIFPELNFYKDGNIKEMYDVAVCSYSLNPIDKKQKITLEEYSKNQIIISSNLKGLKGLRISKNTIVIGKNFKNKIYFKFIFEYYYFFIKTIIQTLREKRKPILSCSKCNNFIYYKNVDKKNKVIICDSCNTVLFEDNLDNILNNFLGLSKKDFILRD